METLSHRQLRNQSGEVLRRVAAGESFVVANDGVPTAMLTPVFADEREHLLATGQLRSARRTRDLSAFRDRRVPSRIGSTDQVLADDRG